ncbi:MAG: transcriptional repressor NrdR [Oscillospiraceae bacterium]|nr:transcriptional repressor NrdR [Oscillospiraceae bacterium]
MKCPFCNELDSKVVDSRPTDEGNSIRRRRECLRCHRRFTTYETVESLPIVVIKRDGSREAFDRAKLIRGLLKSCEKRPVSLRQLEELAEDIEQRLQNRLENEVDSQEVGEMVMEKLKDLDDIAYVRFASVYRRFQDIGSFRDELDRLISEKQK